MSTITMRNGNSITFVADGASEPLRSSNSEILYCDHADIKDQVGPEDFRFTDEEGFRGAPWERAHSDYRVVCEAVASLTCEDQQKLYEFLHNALGRRMPR